MELGYEMLTTSAGFGAEEEADKPWRAAAATTAITSANLSDLAGEEAPTMLVYFEGWSSVGDIPKRQ
jgi:hypothetical protein